MHAFLTPLREDAYTRRWWLAVAMNGVALVIAIWVVQTYHHNRSPLNPVLIPALGGIAVFVVMASKRYRLIDFGDVEKPSLAFGFYSLLVAIGVHAIEDQTLLDRWNGFLWGVIFGIMLSALILWWERPVKAFWGLLAAALLIFAAWGMMQVMNCLLDHGPGYRVQTDVEDRYSTVPSCTAGSRYRSGLCIGTFSQYIILSPAPYGLPARLSVDMGWYRRAHTADSVCIVVRPGRFGARWYRFDLCPRE